MFKAINIIKNFFIISIFFVFFSQLAWSTNIKIDLGLAGEYNTFIFENFQNTSDTQGRLAVGGNACLGADCRGYSVGTSLNPNKNEDYSLVVGGNLEAKSGSVRGNVAVGGSNNNIGPITYYPYTVKTGMSELPIDFESEKKYLTELSHSMSRLTSNGTATTTNSRLNLVGDNQSELQVFSLDESDSIVEYLLSDIQADANIIINVAGKHIDFSNGAGFMNFSDKILFNFFEAETIKLSGGFWGSILAPGADLSGSTGHIEGTLIANQMINSSVQQNHNPFIPFQKIVEIPPSAVPLPSPLLLLATGLVFFLRLNKK
ncbi:MAG: choice-of-anchor A family protein [Gammaproteobacteria bacterium]|nr:choice-of-anchor A family protein [Gammaproteobacteria bacterium]